MKLVAGPEEEGCRQEQGPSARCVDGPSAAAMNAVEPHGRHEHRDSEDVPTEGTVQERRDEFEEPLIVVVPGGAGDGVRGRCRRAGTCPLREGDVAGAHLPEQIPCRRADGSRSRLRRGERPRRPTPGGGIEGGRKGREHMRYSVHVLGNVDCATIR